MTDRHGMAPHRLDEYIEAAIQRLLTEDTVIAEQGIKVARRDHSVVLCGEVESARRREEILRLVIERFPDIPVTIDIGVTRAQAPTEVEELS
jgi:hypothetical protein